MQYGNILYFNGLSVIYDVMKTNGWVSGKVQMQNRIEVVQTRKKIEYWYIHIS